MEAARKLQYFDVESTQGGVVVLDIEYLDRATFGDKPLRTEIVGLFLAQVNGLARNLSLPLDDTSWRFLTHTMKGAAAAVGAKYIANLAAAWEMRFTPTTAEARAQLAAELTGACLAFEKAASQLH
jgi:HPt (histidine-containing phosphotransfer) domain-containing protein